MSEQETPSPASSLSRLKRLIIRLLVVLIMLGSMGAIAGYLFADSLRSQKGPHKEPVLVTIDVGDGRFTIKHKLYRAGVLFHPLHLDIVAMLEAGRFQPRAGEYKIPAAASLAQIITLLNSGKTYQRRLTIIEGW
ncbi:MAG: ABC transporter substrate-binding protein, partial [Candidatus Puniceispirillaceae bacterium]